MAEFLKQEQEALGTLGDDDFANELGGGDDANPFGDFEGNADGEEEVEDLGNAGDFGDFGGEAVPVDGGDDPYAAFGGSSDMPMGMGSGGDGLAGDMASMSMDTAVDPDITNAWKQQQEERIAEIDANSVKKEAEMRAKAKTDLENFMKTYEEGLEGNKMSGEASALADAGGNEDINSPSWDRISDICDFKSAKSVSGKERMKSLLLSLKDEPLSR